jgi:hypothetical protein
MIDWRRVVELAEGLPEVQPGYSYGTPALKLRNKLIARLREDGQTLVVRADIDERDVLIAAAPEKFFLTPHYQAHPWVLVRLGRVDADELRELLTDAWRLRAPKRLAARLDAAGRPSPTGSPAPSPTRALDRAGSRGLRGRAKDAISRTSERSDRSSGRRRTDGA